MRQIPWMPTARAGPKRIPKSNVIRARFGKNALQKVRRYFGSSGSQAPETIKLPQ